MNILITGAKGFIGKNLEEALKNNRDMSLDGPVNIFAFDTDVDISALSTYCETADFIFHLAGVNRPQHEDEFMKGNRDFTAELVELLKKSKNNCPIILSSSIQAEFDHPYGRSKKSGEDILLQHAEQTGRKIFVYRLTNVFGKWSKPNYNSAVATFCNNISMDIPIVVNDRNASVTLTYIDDVVNEFVCCMGESEKRKTGFYQVYPTYEKSLGEIVDLIYAFKDVEKSLWLPDMADLFIKKLYATYLSFVPQEKLLYDLQVKSDERGFFSEIFRTENSGQFSINSCKPGMVKGNHWHHTKTEKFMVVSGDGVIRLRKIGTSDVIEYHVSGDRLQIVDVPCGYTHNIENTSSDKYLIALIWVNEVFDPERSDTYYQQV